MDGILIFMKTLDEHQKVIQRVIELLQQHNLSLKPEKCEFEKSSVEYLGVVVSHNSVKMDPAKVARVSEWPTPTTKKEVQSFLGFTNFYWRFIEGFSHIARPLFDLTKAESVFKWSIEEKLVFDTLKDRITSAPILALPDTPHPTMLRLTVLTLPLEQSYPNRARKTENGIWSPSCLNPCPP